MSELQCDWKQRLEERYSAAAGQVSPAATTEDRKDASEGLDSSKDESSPAAAEDSWYVLASVVLSIVIYVAAAGAFHAFYRPAPAEASEFLPELRGAVRPEPEEKILYLFGLACIPTVPTAMYGMLRWPGRRPTGIMRLLTQPRWLLQRDLGILLSVGGWLCFLAWESEIPHLFALVVCSFFLLGLIVAVVWRLRATPPPVVAITVGALLLCSGWLMIINADWFVSSHEIHHPYDVVLGAVNQVWQGRTILVDSTSQYGVLYPYIAAGSLAPFGLSIHSLSMFFALISLLCWGLAYAAVGRKTGYASPATLVFLAAFLGVTHSICTGAVLSMPDCPVYYQFFPLRVIAGVFFVWFVPIYLRSPTRLLLLAGYFGAGLAVLWNSDTGVVVLGAWYALQVFQAVARWRQGVPQLIGRVATHGALSALTVAVAVGAYMLFARLRSGQFPDLATFGQYQRIFYVSGFFLLPMKMWEFWQPVVLLQASVVAWCLRRAIWKSATTDHAWYFFIAIYGLGTFSYYQGRSHFRVLPTTFYPAVLLSFLLAYDGWQAIRRRRLSDLLVDSGKRLTLIGVGLSSVGFALGLTSFFRAVPAAAIYAYKDAPQHMRQFPEVVRRALRGKKGIVLTDPGNFLHLTMGSQSSLPFASACEVMLTGQLHEVQRAIDRQETEFILLDTEFVVAHHVHIGGLRPVWQSGTLILFARRHS